MTVNPSRTREFNIDHLVLMSYRTAALLNENQALNEAKKVAGRDFLETILDELQTKGLYARSIVLENLQLATGTQEYTLPAYVLDVISDGTYIDEDDPNPPQPRTGLIVTQVDRETRQRVGMDSATGSPTLFYVDRTSTIVKVWIWPIPTENGLIRFQYHRLGADSNDGNATPDVERFWVQHLIWRLAYQLATANTMNPSHILNLKTMAAELLVSARAYANPRGSQQVYIDHPTPWSR